MRGEGELVVTHGFAQCQAPGAPVHEPENSKFGWGMTLALGFWFGWPTATTRLAPVNRTTGTARATNPRRTATCRVLS